MEEGSSSGGIIVALVGESGAGKSTTGRLLAERGFHLVQISAKIRTLAAERWDQPSRRDIQMFAKEMQRRHGNDYFARLALDGSHLRGFDKVVIDGVRNLEERDYICGLAKTAAMHCVVVALVATAETRFERVLSRARPGDPVERSCFEVDDARALGTAADAFQQNGLLVEQADHTIVNTGERRDLEQALGDLIKQLRPRSIQTS